MSLQSVLFEFNGIIINDESIHRQLIDELLVSENLRPTAKNKRKLCLGDSGRSCLLKALAAQGRSIDNTYLQKLLSKKAQSYQQKLLSLPELPIYPDLIDFLDQLRSAGLQLGIVTDALRLEVETVLEKSNLRDHFSVIVAAENDLTSKPAPDGYLMAISSLKLQPQECLAIENTFPGIQSAKAAGIPVVGIAHTYPLHMLQRRASWAADCFADLEINRIQLTYDNQPTSLS